MVNMIDPPPPPPPAPNPTPVVPKVVKISVVLNSRALELPKPIYPVMAKQIGLSGSVNVQVLIDETGKVIQAKAIGGHPLFIVEAQRAAMRARFSPTLIGEQPVKVSGVITYNFVMP
jgi:periplasmic protein TonB